MYSKTGKIVSLLRDYCPDISIIPVSGWSAEFGGNLPAQLVGKLQDLGADVCIYHLGRADQSTVVTF